MVLYRNPDLLILMGVSDEALDLRAIDSITDGIFNSRYWLGKVSFSCCNEILLLVIKGIHSAAHFPTTSRKIRATFVFSQ